MDLSLIIMLTSISSLIFIGLIYMIIVLTNQQRKAIEDTHYVLSDRDLLLMIHNEKDQLITAEKLARTTGMKKSHAKARIRTLYWNGVITAMYTNMAKYYYSLESPIQVVHDVILSEDPFMTLEDLILIFEKCDYQVTFQDLILITGLPFKVLKKEMKYFEKEKIVKALNKTVNNTFTKKIFILNEPYRSNPDAFIKKDTHNLELEKLVEKIKVKNKA